MVRVPIVRTEPGTCADIGLATPYCCGTAPLTPMAALALAPVVVIVVGYSLFAEPGRNDAAPIRPLVLLELMLPAVLGRTPSLEG